MTIDGGRLGIRMEVFLDAVVLRAGIQTLESRHNTKQRETGRAKQ
jgi:hypothetical protein